MLFPQSFDDTRLVVDWSLTLDAQSDLAVETLTALRDAWRHRTDRLRTFFSGPPSALVAAIARESSDGLSVSVNVWDNVSA